MTQQREPSPEERFYADLSHIVRAPTATSVRAEVLAKLAQRGARHSLIPVRASLQPVRRGGRFSLVLAGGLASLAFAIWLWPGLLRPARIAADVTHAESAEATAIAQPTDGHAPHPSVAINTLEPHAVVVGVDPLALVGSGPRRSLLPGEAIPLDLAVCPESERGAVLRIGGRADVRLDAGAELSIEAPSPDRDGLALHHGRISIAAHRAPRPIRVRITDLGVNLTTEAAVFGALVTSGGRWSAAVREGELRVAHATGDLPLAAGLLAGARAAEVPIVRPIPDALELTVDASREARGWIVRGLADVLSAVHVGEVEAALDARGAFEAQPITGVRFVRVVVADAAGRTVSRELALSSSGVTTPSRPRASPRLSPGSGGKRVTPGRPVSPGRGEPAPAEAETPESFRIRSFRW